MFHFSWSIDIWRDETTQGESKDYLFSAHLYHIRLSTTLSLPATDKKSKQENDEYSSIVKKEKDNLMVTC